MKYAIHSCLGDQYTLSHSLPRVIGLSEQVIYVSRCISKCASSLSLHLSPLTSKHLPLVNYTPDLSTSQFWSERKQPLVLYKALRSGRILLINLCKSTEHIPFSNKIPEIIIFFTSDFHSYLSHFRSARTARSCQI